MKLYFLNRSLSHLSDSTSRILNTIKSTLVSSKDVEEVTSPKLADAIIIEEENSFKNFNYIQNLRADDLVSSFPEKVFTINTDDCATGLLRGLYTSLPKTRFDRSIYTSIPYMNFPNELVFGVHDNIKPTYLATWRGNTKSNRIRAKMVRLLSKQDEFCVKQTNSWLNHTSKEKIEYVKLIRAAKFSLCPAGWAPVSFRIYESMALGRCPVIIADDFNPPKGPRWEDFALFYPEKDISSLSSFLLRNENIADELGKKAFEAWQKYFCSDVVKEYYANALLSLIKSTPKTSKKAELKRWNSFALYWDNKWTLPQRIFNKVERYVKRPLNV